MRYSLKKEPYTYTVSVEASFSLLDFLMLFSCLLLGVYFAIFLWIFAGAVFLKLFSRDEFIFDLDTYTVTHYTRIISYLRFKRFFISFDEIDRLLLSNHASGNVLRERGFGPKEWYTLEIVTKNKVFYISKVGKEDIDDIIQLYLSLEYQLGEYFTFTSEFIEMGEMEGDGGLGLIE